jgi:putative colanic acid biosynthesis UDP-glucose lipid carrier transferase
MALAIKLDSRGPVLFRQNRVGFNGNIFQVLKFRTMTHAPEPDGELPQARRNDSRVTRIGKILRRTSLDELPQLVNVLRGDMSLVGPRPHAVPHDEYFAARINGYLGRHRMQPGITGWAQVNGLRGETETLGKMQRRVDHDLAYIEDWSLLLDLRIILRTLLCLVDRNAY